LNARTAVRVALLALAAAGAVVALGSPRFTWENAGLRVEHPLHQGSAALLGAAALAGAALSGWSRAVATAGLAVTAALALLGVHRLAWRVEAVEPGLGERTIAGWTRVAWADVERVDPGPGVLRVRARDGREIAVGTRAFSAADRTRLERTIARRVRETAR
jgi:hypothetical protein